MFLVEVCEARSRDPLSYLRHGGRKRVGLQAMYCRSVPVAQGPDQTSEPKTHDITPSTGKLSNWSFTGRNSSFQRC